MSRHDLVTRLLGTHGEDAGCEGGLELLAEYVENELSGKDAARLYPSLLEHLRNCPACAEDYEGLVALARRQRSG